MDQEQTSGEVESLSCGPYLLISQGKTQTEKWSGKGIKEIAHYNEWKALSLWRVHAAEESLKPATKHPL